VDPAGSGYRPMAGSCEYGDEPAGFGATVLVNYTSTVSFCSIEMNFKVGLIAIAELQVTRNIIQRSHFGRHFWT
jgi:hypothetical protein